MNKLSVAIITLNEKSNIRRCLQSINWVDEIVIVDSGSKDNTLEICREFDCTIENLEWQGFGLQKQAAVDLTTNNWVLSLDADEEVTSELKKAIMHVLENPVAAAYSIKRKSFYLGKMINHCGWDHDFPIRLFNKNKCGFNDEIVHESLQVNGRVKRITVPMMHYTYPSISSHLTKMDRYSTLGAQKLAARNKKTTPAGACIRGFFKFLKMFFLQKGFLDGVHGFVLSVNSGYGVFLKYIKLWEIRRSK